MQGEQNKVNFYLEEALGDLLEVIGTKVSNGMRIILKESFGRGGRQTLGDALNGFSGTNRQGGQGVLLPVNVYPGGVPTNEVYPEFLCVCAGKTRLEQALRKILSYCNAAERAMPIEMEKTVILLTDKWSAHSFDRYKAELKDFAENENVRVYVFLATEYTFNEIKLLELQNFGCNPAMHFFTGNDSRYFRCLKLMGNIVQFEHDETKYRLNLLTKKLWLDDKLVCRYIPRQAIFEFCMMAKNFNYSDELQDDNANDGEYILTMQHCRYCYSLDALKSNYKLNDILGLHTAMLDLLKSVGLADEHGLVKPVEEEYE